MENSSDSDVLEDEPPPPPPPPPPEEPPDGCEADGAGWECCTTAEWERLPITSMLPETEQFFPEWYSPSQATKSSPAPLHESLIETATAPSESLTHTLESSGFATGMATDLPETSACWAIPL